MPNPPDGQAPYPHVEQQADYPRLEERDPGVVGRRRGPSRASVEARPGGHNEYVFYDGPPFANGLPHYGHLLTGFVKDAVPRYQTMRGQRVERRFGWDCHGLPAETEAEKELGVSGRGRHHRVRHRPVQRLLPDVGACATPTNGERYVTRQARWVDFEQRLQDHGPLLHGERHVGLQAACGDKGLLYEGYRVLPYCWECETPLSNFETRQDDAYRDRQDPAVTVRLQPRSRRRDAPASSRRRSLCGRGPPRRGRCRPTWPWPSAPTSTTPCSSATAGRGHRWPRPRVARLRDAARGLRAARDVSGRRAGRAHATVPLFPYFADHPERLPGARRPTSSPPTTAPASSTWRPGSARTTSGVCAAAGIAVVCPVDDRARFTAEVPDFAGPAGLRGQPADHPSPARATGVLVRGRLLRAQLPPLLAHRHARSSTGRSRPGSSR